MVYLRFQQQISPYSLEIMHTTLVSNGISSFVKGRLLMRLLTPCRSSKRGDYAGRTYHASGVVIVSPIVNMACPALIRLKHFAILKGNRLY